MKSHKYWSIGALVSMIGTCYTGYKDIRMIRLRYGSNPIPQIHTANLTVEKVTISSYNMLKSE